VSLGHVNDRGRIDLVKLGALFDHVNHLLKSSIWHFLGESPGPAGAAAIVLGEVKGLSGKKRNQSVFRRKEGLFG